MDAKGGLQDGDHGEAGLGAPARVVLLWPGARWERRSALRLGMGNTHNQMDHPGINTQAGVNLQQGKATPPCSTPACAVFIINR